MHFGCNIQWPWWLLSWLLLMAFPGAPCPHQVSGNESMPVFDLTTSDSVAKSEAMLPHVTVETSHVLRLGEVRLSAFRSQPAWWRSSSAWSWRMGITLLAFFGASCRLTQFREELKDVDESHRTGGQRDWQQVRHWPAQSLISDPDLHFLIY